MFALSLTILSQNRFKVRERSLLFRCNYLVIVFAMAYKRIEFIANLERIDSLNWTRRLGLLGVQGIFQDGYS